MSKRGKTKEVDQALFAEPRKYCSNSKYHNVGLGKLSKQGTTKEVGQALFTEPQKNSLKYGNNFKDYNVGLGQMSKQWKTKDVDHSLFAEPQKNPPKYCNNSKDYNVGLGKTSKQGKRKEVDETLSAEPQKKSINYCINSKGYNDWLRKIVSETVDEFWHQNTAKPKVRQLVDERNKAPPGPLPVPSMPVPLKEVPKSVSGTTPPSSNQPGSSAMRNYCTISSIPSTGIDPKKNSFDVVAGGSRASLPNLVDTSKSNSPNMLNDHEKGPENDKGKEKGESSSSMSARIKRTQYKESEYPFNEAALQSSRQLAEKLDLLHATDGRGRRDSSHPDAQACGPISALAGGVGVDSFELYKRCLLERDQAILTEVSLTQLEEEMAHSFMQNMAFSRQLTLRAVFWKEKEGELNAKIEKVQADLKKAEEALALVTSQMKEGFAKNKEEMASKDQELAVLTKENDKEKERQFELGKRVGREDFLQSEEFQTMLKKARHDGVCDFKKSPEFVALSQAVDHGMTAFNTCQAQLQKLGGLNGGFDRSQPDVIKTENLEDNPETIMRKGGHDAKE